MLKKIVSLVLVLVLLLGIATTGSAATTNVTSKLNPHSTFKAWVKQLKPTNKDVVGWLKVPNTNINVPIVQGTREQGNNYYNTRDWKGVDYSSRVYPNYAMTSTFLDVRVVTNSTWEKSSKNMVIYGHNWTNLSKPYNIGEKYTNHKMLAQLPSYTDITFAKENPYIYYSTENLEGVWKVFAVAACEVSSSFNYNAPNPSDAEFKKLIAEWKARSVLNFDVDVNEKDRLLTLSTCTREIPGVGGTQRFVVVARLLRPGETENDPVKVTANTDYKKPKFS